MTRSEEELRVGTAQRETGRARLRKYVVTENVTQTVPVQREEVRVEREPITDANRDAATSGADISEEEHEVVLHAEEPVVEKRAVPKERVRLDNGHASPRSSRSPRRSARSRSTSTATARRRGPSTAPRQDAGVRQLIKAGPNGQAKNTGGVSLAKGPVGIIGMVLLAYGVTALVFGGHSLHHPCARRHGERQDVARPGGQRLERPAVHRHRRGC